ncbi:MAG: PAS domain S-box protein [Chloroflexi bacterium]|nr:PAS domain S-box protein [Chloroflexota bacterium]
MTGAALWCAGLLLSADRYLNSHRPWGVDMQDQNTTTKDQLIDRLRQRVMELETSVMEYRRAVERLQDTESSYRLLAKNMTDGVFVVDLKGHMTYASPYVRRMLGYNEPVESRELTGERLTPDSREVLAEVFNEIIAVAKDRRKDMSRTWTVEWQMIRMDGSTMWVEGRINILRSEDGHATGIVCVYRDIDERKKAQELFRRLADSSPIGIYILQDGKLQFVNRQFQYYGGYDEEELLGTDAARFVLPGDRGKVRQAAIAMLRGERSEPYEFRFVTRDGKIRWVMERVASIEYNRRRATLGNFMDITERKQHEEALEHSESQLRLLSQRILNIQEEERSRIARDLHDQLGQELVFLKMKAVSLAEQLGGASVVHGAAREVVSLIEQVRATSHRIAVDVRPAMLDDLGLLKAIQWYAEQFEERTSIVCLVDASAADLGLPKEVSTAAYRILQEALTNVWKHARASQVRVKVNKKGETMALRISDNGIGFDCSKISAEGALGLLGMRERAHLVGGTLKISSRPGKGTEIMARLPTMLI